MSPLRLLLGAFFLVAGALHFIRPGTYEAIVPDVLPLQRELVYASGVAEIAGGAAVLAERTRRAGGWWLIATLVAVLPANVQMAIDADEYRSIPEWALWLRLPVQGVLIWWVWAAALRRR